MDDTLTMRATDEACANEWECRVLTGKREALS